MARIRDNACISDGKTSRFLTREEVMRIYPQEGHPRRLSYIFKVNKAENIPTQEAALLLKKYPTLSSADEVIKADPINKLGYNELKARARELGYKNKDVMVKKDILIQMIKEKHGHDIS